MEINETSDNPENNLSMIDLAYLDEITGGDAELKGELINMFETETVIQLGNISDANKAANYDVLKQAIHKYRSSLFSVGLLKTSTKYKEIESTLKRNEPIANLTGVLYDLENESKLGLQILKGL
ncbi:Hpt domain-containing protein [Dyadobacter arcticus]|uniref:HPt (Histidine-containing phosphotransfer) domain-containing protein n=1 Tax=Dyadobacter arcticus TaxID=1078754 RepID=A0ABX0URN6_9BACT|nr:Hpt domain-containing protein [Dyadobacter arcticus]NIJ53646.1 HPt (histidine-containing phosphotransfer) domain-containing protein [Dyadobacter arcticus]